MAAKLNNHQEALLAVIAAGDAPPGDSQARQRLAALKRLGYVTRERTADGETWAVTGEAKPKRTRKRAPRKR